MAGKERVSIHRVAIAEIQLGPRPRHDLGDIDSLATSIRELGLLQPIGVTSAKLLIWGERRLRACESLGWTEIEEVLNR